MARRNKNSSGASLDSLLDTMTNVVGILVIVLVVTQLGVGEAVDRITAEMQKDDKYSPEKIEEARQNIDLARADRVKLDKELEALLAQLRSGGNDALAKGQLNDLQGQISFTKDDLDKVLKTRAGEVAAHNAKAEEAKKEAEEYKKKEDELQKQFAAASEQLSKFKAMLSDTPERVVLAAKVVNLPNPRTAPEGATPAYMICREGKVYPWNREEMRKGSQERAELLVVQRNLAGNPKLGIDPKRLIPMFDSLRLNDEWFLLKLSANGRQPRLVFERKKNAGYTIEDIDNPRGPFQRGLKSIDPSKHYIRFTVWNDSFETYLAARAVVTDHGLLAGWDITASADEMSIPLGGKIQFGPEPPPPTDPPPKPNPNDPPPKPVPVDTVD